MKKLFLFLILVMSVIFGYSQTVTVLPELNVGYTPCPNYTYSYYFTGTWLSTYHYVIEPDTSCGIIIGSDTSSTVYVKWKNSINVTGSVRIYDGQNPTNFRCQVSIKNPPTLAIVGNEFNCIGDTSDYHIVITQGFGVNPVDYNWTVTNGLYNYTNQLPIDSGNITVTWLGSGNNIITFSFFYNCPTDTTYLQVKVNPQPNIISSNDSIVSKFDTSHFESNLNTFGNYNWLVQKQDTLNPNSGFQILDSIPYTNKLNIQWVDTGKYTVSLHFDSCGINPASVKSILVTLDNLVSISENNKQDVIIYPNPVQDKLFFNNIDENSQILIYNLNGELLRKIYNTLNYIDVGDLYNGLYIIKISSREKIITKRFCKI